MIFEDDYTYITRKIRSDSAFVLLERDIDLNNPVSIRNDSLVIDGNGYTINANGKTRIFNITGGNIVLKNFIFKNGNASADIPDDGGFGGVIRNESHLKLENCLFFNNEAEKDGNDIINHGELEISDCMFSRNSSNHSIFNLGSIKISENQYFGFWGLGLILFAVQEIPYMLMPLIRPETNPIMNMTETSAVLDRCLLG